MISQGTDGLSRGDLSSGVMQGEDFLKFLPFNETALEQQKDLKSKVRSWLVKPEEWKFANTEDWFHEVFVKPKGKSIWSSPPCLA